MIISRSSFWLKPLENDFDGLGGGHSNTPLFTHSHHKIIMASRIIIMEKHKISLAILKKPSLTIVNHHQSTIEQTMTTIDEAFFGDPQSQLWPPSGSSPSYRDVLLDQFFPSQDYEWWLMMIDGQSSFDGPSITSRCSQSFSYSTYIFFNHYLTITQPLSTMNILTTTS